MPGNKFPFTLKGKPEKDNSILDDLLISFLPSPDTDNTIANFDDSSLVSWIDSLKLQVSETLTKQHLEIKKFRQETSRELLRNKYRHEIVLDEFERLRQVLNSKEQQGESDEPGVEVSLSEDEPSIPDEVTYESLNGSEQPSPLVESDNDSDIVEILSGSESGLVEDENVCLDHSSGRDYSQSSNFDDKSQNDISIRDEVDSCYSASEDQNNDLSKIKELNGFSGRPGTCASNYTSPTFPVTPVNFEDEAIELDSDSNIENQSGMEYEYYADGEPVTEFDINDHANSSGSNNNEIDADILLEDLMHSHGYEVPQNHGSQVNTKPTLSDIKRNPSTLTSALSQEEENSHNDSDVVLSKHSQKSPTESHPMMQESSESPSSFNEDIQILTDLHALECENQVLPDSVVDSPTEENNFDSAQSSSDNEPQASNDPRILDEEAMIILSSEDTDESIKPQNDHLAMDETSNENDCRDSAMEINTSESLSCDDSDAEKSASIILRSDQSNSQPIDQNVELSLNSVEGSNIHSQNELFADIAHEALGKILSQSDISSVYLTDVESDIVVTGDEELTSLPVSPPRNALSVHNPAQNVEITLASEPTEDPEGNRSDGSLADAEYEEDAKGTASEPVPLPDLKFPVFKTIKQEPLEIVLHKLETTEKRFHIKLQTVNELRSVLGMLNDNDIKENRNLISEDESIYFDCLQLGEESEFNRGTTTPFKVKDPESELKDNGNLSNDYFHIKQEHDDDCEMITCEVNKTKDFPESPENVVYYDAINYESDFSDSSQGSTLKESGSADSEKYPVRNSVLTLNTQLSTLGHGECEDASISSFSRIENDRMLYENETQVDNNENLTTDSCNIFQSKENYCEPSSSAFHDEKDTDHKEPSNKDAKVEVSNDEQYHVSSSSHDQFFDPISLNNSNIPQSYSRDDLNSSPEQILMNADTNYSSSLSDEEAKDNSSGLFGTIVTDREDTEMLDAKTNNLHDLDFHASETITILEPATENETLVSVLTETYIAARTLLPTSVEEPIDVRDQSDGHSHAQCSLRNFTYTMTDAVSESDVKAPTDILEPEDAVQQIVVESFEETDSVLRPSYVQEIESLRGTPKPRVDNLLIGYEGNEKEHIGIGYSDAVGDASKKRRSNIFESFTPIKRLKRAMQPFLNLFKKPWEKTISKPHLDEVDSDIEVSEISSQELNDLLCGSTENSPNCDTADYENTAPYTSLNHEDTSLISEIVQVVDADHFTSRNSLSDTESHGSSINFESKASMESNEGAIQTLNACETESDDVTCDSEAVGTLKSDALSTSESSNVINDSPSELLSHDSDLPTPYNDSGKLAQDMSDLGQNSVESKVPDLKLTVPLTENLNYKETQSSLSGSEESPGTERLEDKEIEIKNDAEFQSSEEFQNLRAKSEEDCSRQPVPTFVSDGISTTGDKSDVIEEFKYQRRGSISKATKSKSDAVTEASEVPGSPQGNFPGVVSGQSGDEGSINGSKADHDHNKSELTEPHTASTSKLVEAELDESGQRSHDDTNQGETDHKVGKGTRMVLGLEIPEGDLPPPPRRTLRSQTKHDDIKNSKTSGTSDSSSAALEGVPVSSTGGQANSSNSGLENALKTPPTKVDKSVNNAITATTSTNSSPKAGLRISSGKWLLDLTDHPALRTRSRSPIKRTIQQLSSDIDDEPLKRRKRASRRGSRHNDKEKEFDGEHRGRPRDRKK